MQTGPEGRASVSLTEQENSGAGRSGLRGAGTGSLVEVRLGQGSGRERGVAEQPT